MPDAMLTVGLVIPTLNAGERWKTCLRAIHEQSFVPNRSLIIDSASTDSTVAEAKAAGFEVLSIERSEFNHGGTRQLAADVLTDCNIIIYLTQDAIPADSFAFANIVNSFSDPAVAVAYGRQVPHRGATLVEAHAREFNYGPVSVKKNLGKLPEVGTKVFFCSNSFAAYRRELLMKLGGFRRDLILGEDMEFAARAVSAGYTNHYCADARVFHSHNYSAAEVFRRYFDIGVFDAENGWIRKAFGSHRGQGIRFLKSELNFLRARGVSNVPRILVQTSVKLLGYRLGRLHRTLPNGIKRKLSMSPAHWR